MEWSEKPEVVRNRRSTVTGLRDAELVGND
jgi:hypothetical protein